jgi:2-polyprenyl-3-methyl-5-hydroxy-6-metoxy-1,4-benzoquinol methylase
VSAISALIRPDRYPLSSRYDPRWVIALEMGPHPLWQLEDILPALALEPGSRVLDLGCGRGATSVFLARECGVTVTACQCSGMTPERPGANGGSARLAAFANNT